MDSDLKKLSEQVIAYRAINKISLKKFAKLVGVSDYCIRKVERCERVLPTKQYQIKYFIDNH